MKLFEYRGKEFFQSYNIPIPKGKLVTEESDFKDLKYPFVLKAQVPVGGRGKAGGIQIVHNNKEAKDKLSQIQGMDIKGFVVNKVLAEEQIEIKNEFYMSIMLDRTKKMPLLMISSKGGMDIESVDDDQISKQWINPFIGIQPFHIRRTIQTLKLQLDQAKQITDILTKLYTMFRELDCELVEINPLIVSTSGRVIALDSKVIINDDALYRHPDIIAEHVELTDLEKDAKEKGIAFIQLDGDIGVIANGAGLTMATLDALTYYNGKAGIFLDLGGTDDPEKVKQAFELMKKAKPSVIFLNLFGGITKCDTVAKGVQSVISKEGIDCPVVTRIKGMNEEKAKEILKDAGLITAETLQDAAKKSCDIAGGI